MGKLHKNNDGFSAVEAVLVLVIVGLIAFIGYYVYHTKQNVNKTLTTTSSASTPARATNKKADPYAGWQSYTMGYEKISFQYPAAWKMSDESTLEGRHDMVTLSGANNFTFSIVDGVGNGGDSLPLLSSNPSPLTYLNKPAYLVFINAKTPNPDGPSSVDRDHVSGAMLLLNPNDQTSSPADKNVHGGDQYNGVNGPEGSYMSISMSYNGQNNLTLSAAKADSQYKDSALVIESMHY
jgi:hypothetical protein